jgi:hypothetical protein
MRVNRKKSRISSPISGSNMPNELRKAREIVADRNAILETPGGKREHPGKRPEKGGVHAGEQEVTKLASAKANEMIQNTQLKVARSKRRPASIRQSARKHGGVFDKSPP